MLTGVGSSLLKGPVGDRLKKEARDFATAKGSDFVQSLGGRLEGVTQRLEDHAENPNGRKDKDDDGADDGQEDGEDSKQGRLASFGSGLKDKAKSLVGKGDDDEDGDDEDDEDGDGEEGEDGGGDKKGRGKGKSGPKMINIIEDINIGVPVSVAYDQWSQFQEFASFMKGVRGVDAKDETESNWRGKVWWSTRSWSARVTEQIPDRKIAWTTDGAKGTTKGIITFHPLADDLTKVLVVLEYYPKGFMEKTANIWRAFGRRVRLDLKHFRRFVTVQGEATGSWRGEIRDGEVVREPDENDDYRREDDYRPPNRLNEDEDSDDSDLDDEDDDFDDEFDDEDDDFDDEDEDDDFDDEDDESDGDEPSDESDEDEPTDESDEDEPTDESDEDEPSDESDEGEPTDESDEGEPTDESDEGEPTDESDEDSSDEPAAESDQGDGQAEESEDSSDEPTERPVRRRRPSSREGSRQRSERSSDGERNGRSSEGRRSPRRARKSSASA
ncbi:SRPBCC family protein [Actinopolymorpha cephalotaxi]|uniref:SRPBCC family protein n=1 Tax=Actinopolymorpha cephalotaxi TaxID=504797 RepID=UPI001EDA8EC3|nr:SRPBCC family protein [Actinopolymorpha cephalotaxi]